MNGDVRQEIGKRLTDLRKKKGITQERLAEMTGFSQSNIWRIEAGKYSVGLDILAKIADALQCDVKLIERD